jgi:hypothetical protein
MKEDKKDKHGLAINIMKFQYYNFEFFNCQEIVLYETLIVLGGNSFAKREEFFHSTQTIVDKTGIKRHSVDRVMVKFKKMGIIDYQIKGMPKVKFIKILWENILEILPEIYQFDKVEEYFDGSTKPLIDFYQLLAENNEKFADNTEEKNNIKNSKEEYKKEINASGNENSKIAFREKLISVIKNVIDKHNVLSKKNPIKFNSYDIIRNQKYNDDKAIYIYNESDILNSFERYFDECLAGKVEIKISLLGYFFKEEDGKFPIIERYMVKSLTRKKILKYDQTSY